MATILAQLELLTKYVMGGTANTTILIPPKFHYKDEGVRRMDDENWYLANPSGGSHPTYHRQDGNHGWTNQGGGQV